MNLSTFLVLLVLVAIVGSIVLKMYKDKKAGKLSCGGDCGSCGHGSLCETSSHLYDIYKDDNKNK